MTLSTSKRLLKLHRYTPRMNLYAYNQVGVAVHRLRVRTFFSGGQMITELIGWRGWKR